jgi:hypothetical protein
LLYPDLLIFRRHAGSVAADIIDPHSPALEDAAAKARALARYAGEPHAIALGRIELVKVISQKIIRLDAKKPEIRKHLLGVRDRASLDTLFTTLGKRD